MQHQKGSIPKVWQCFNIRSYANINHHINQVKINHLNRFSPKTCDVTMILSCLKPVGIVLYSSLMFVYYREFKYMYTYYKHVSTYVCIPSLYF